MPQDARAVAGEGPREMADLPAGRGLRHRGGTAAEDATRANLAGVLPRRGLGRHHPGLPPLDHECLRPEHAIPVVDVDTILKEFENDLLRYGQL